MYTSLGSSCAQCVHQVHHQQPPPPEEQFCLLIKTTQKELISFVKACHLKTITYQCIYGFGMLMVYIRSLPDIALIFYSSRYFQLYKQGVYHNRKCSSKHLDHGVLVVGYGTYQNQEYWLMKNRYHFSFPIPIH